MCTRRSHTMASAGPSYDMALSIVAATQICKMTKVELQNGQELQDGLRFTGISTHAAQALGEMLKEYITEVGTVAQNLASHAGRTESSFDDVRGALRAVDGTTMEDITEAIYREPDPAEFARPLPPFPAPVRANICGCCLAQPRRIACMRRGGKNDGVAGCRWNRRRHRTSGRPRPSLPDPPGHRGVSSSLPAALPLCPRQTRRRDARARAGLLELTASPFARRSPRSPRSPAAARAPAAAGAAGGGWAQARTPALSYRTVDGKDFGSVPTCLPPFPEGSSAASVAAAAATASLEATASSRGRVAGLRDAEARLQLGRFGVVDVGQGKHWGSTADNSREQLSFDAYHFKSAVIGQPVKARHGNAAGNASVRKRRVRLTTETKACTIFDPPADQVCALICGAPRPALSSSAKLDGGSLCSANPPPRPLTGALCDRSTRCRRPNSCRCRRRLAASSCVRSWRATGRSPCRGARPSRCRQL